MKTLDLMQNQSLHELVFWQNNLATCVHGHRIIEPVKIYQISLGKRSCMETKYGQQTKHVGFSARANSDYVYKLSCVHVGVL